MSDCLPEANAPDVVPTTGGSLERIAREGSFADLAWISLRDGPILRCATSPSGHVRSKVRLHPPSGLTTSCRVLDEVFKGSKRHPSGSLSHNCVTDAKPLCKSGWSPRLLLTTLPSVSILELKNDPPRQGRRRCAHERSSHRLIWLADLCAARGS